MKKCTICGRQIYNAKNATKRCIDCVAAMKGKTHRADRHYKCIAVDDWCADAPMLHSINTISVWRTLQVRGLVLVNVIKRNGKWIERSEIIRRVGIDRFAPCDDPRSSPAVQPKEIKIYRRETKA